MSTILRISLIKPSEATGSQGKTVITSLNKDGPWVSSFGKIATNHPGKKAHNLHFSCTTKLAGLCYQKGFIHVE